MIAFANLFVNRKGSGIGKDAETGGEICKVLAVSAV